MSTEYEIVEALFTNDEYESLAAIQVSNFPESPQSPEEIREEDEQIDRSKFVSERMFAQTTRDQRVGYIDYNHRPSRYHPQKFWLWMEVMPEFQNQGIGAKLYEAMELALKPHEPITYLVAARESMPHTVRFFEKRGFYEVSRTFQSHLEIERFDLEAFPKKENSNSEVAITSLAEELKTNSRCLEKLHELHTALGADVPSTDAYTPVDFDTFKKVNIDHPNVIREGYFIARVGDRYVGESNLHKSQEQSDVLTQEFTGVLGEFRRQGIAMALKLKTIEYAKAHSIKKIKTWNDSTNHGMLAINDALGFVREPAWIKYQLDLA